MATNGYNIEQCVYLLIFLANMCFILPSVYSSVSKGKKRSYISKCNTNYTPSPSRSVNQLNDEWLANFMYPLTTNQNETVQIQISDYASKRKRRSIDYKSAFQIIGVYMAIHKYFEVDRRYDALFRTFFRGFPSPPFLHPKINKNCGMGFEECIKEVFKSSKMSRYLNKLIATRFTHLPDWNDYVTMTKTQTHFFPFASWMEYFAYKATASYFMCWYTMKKEPRLAYFMDGNNCLMLLNEAGLGRITDYRMDDKPFQCAMILFCPDACYGRKENGNVYSPNHIDVDKGNPCRKFKNKTCTVVQEENNSFLGLMWNVFNVTCSCLGQGRGYKYDARKQECVDINECTEKLYKCHNGKICRNIIGGYACTCRRGFKFNIEVQMCETPEETRIRILRQLERKNKNGGTISNINALLFLTILTHITSTM